MTRTSSRIPAASLLGMATLAALGLGVAMPAQAQSLLLNSGDAVTVSGAGTVGTINNTPVADPAAKSYTDAGGNNANGNAAAMETDGTSAFTLATGGTLTDTVSGNALLVLGTGPVLITGGAITAAPGGTGLDAGSGTVTVSGGTITGGDDGFGIYASSSTVTIAGGDIPTVGGNSGFGLATGGGGVIDLVGTGFSYTPVGGTPTPLVSGAISTAVDFEGVLTGTLSDGQRISTQYFDGGTIEVLAAAPEPSQFAGLGVGLLGLSGLALKARRRA